MVNIRKLGDGITVVTEPISYVGSCAFGIWVKTGAADESKELSGISHFVEHMMFKGTESRSARGIAEEIDNIGGQINAFTGKEATCYYVKTLESNLTKAMDVVLDMFAGSKFDTEEMDRERNVIKEEMKMTQDTPDEDVQETIMESVFNGNVLEKSIIGTNESLDGINREKMLDYVSRRYTKDNIVVSVAGKFDEEAVLAMLEERLAKLPDHAQAYGYTPHDYRPEFIVKKKDIEQSHISLGIQTVSLDDSERYAFSLLSNIMGGSMSSRFFQNIRETKGLAYSVYSVNTAFSRGGYFDIYAGVAHENVEKTIEAVKEELQMLKNNGVSAEELAKAKEQMKSNYIFGRENINARMFGNGKAITLLGAIKTQEQTLAEIDAINLERLHDAAEVVCNMDNYSAALVTNRDFNLEALVRA